MSIFRSILDKLGIGRDEGRSAGSAGAKPRAPSQSTSGSAAAPRPSAAGTAPASPLGTPPPAAAQMARDAQPISEVDVAEQLERRAAASPQKLNWRTSIVDLLKLLDLDSSLESRKSLATELGAPPDLLSDSARMNMWLHKAVLRKLAANGGKVPQDLLD